MKFIDKIYSKTDDAIKFIKENEVLNPLEYEEFQRIVDTFTELKNNKN